MKLCHSFHHGYPKSHFMVSLSISLQESRRDSYKRSIFIMVEFGRYRYTISLHFGSRGFPPSRFRVGDSIICHNDYETCRLREGSEYSVQEVLFKPDPCDPSMMMENVKLKGLEQPYEAYRFSRPGETWEDPYNE